MHQSLILTKSREYLKQLKVNISNLINLFYIAINLVIISKSF